MQTATLDAVKAILGADPSLSPADRKSRLTLLKYGVLPQPKPADSATTVSRILQRKEVAARLSRSLRFVDLLCDTGVLKRVTAPGRQRAMGITEESVNWLIAGKGVGDVAP